MARTGGFWIVGLALAAAGTVLASGLLIYALALGRPVAGTISNCDDVPAAQATGAAQYRDATTYDGRNIPLREIKEWAAQQPTFVGMWLDGEHNRWATLAFSADAAARQLEVEELFPGAGTLTVAVDWTRAGLESLQASVINDAKPRVISAGVAIDRGVVMIGVAELDAETVAAVESQFGGQRVCIEQARPYAYD